MRKEDVDALNVLRKDIFMTILPAGKGREAVILGGHDYDFKLSSYLKTKSIFIMKDEIVSKVSIWISKVV